MALSQLYYVADPNEYSQRLRSKLQEEVAEFMEAGAQTAGEELSDVLEVIYALAKDLGMSVNQLKTRRALKAKERGKFDFGIVWMGNGGR